MVEKVKSSALILEKARFSYKDTLIFKDADLTIHQGETLCLLGPNGCGKTTLIDCILGINKLDQGRIMLGDQPMNQLSFRKIAQMIAYVPQNHDRHFSFSVMDVLLMGRAPYTSFYSSPDTADRDIAENLLSSMGLSHLADRDYTQLSGGETQLVMIMRALIQETSIIIMDEPTAHLDFKHELIVLETIVRLVKEKGLTLIMATHFPNHAFYFENEGIPVQVAFMNRQKVQLTGPPSSVLTEENLASFYHVRTSVVAHSLRGKGTIRHIIPIETLDK